MERQPDCIQDWRLTVRGMNMVHGRGCGNGSHTVARGLREAGVSLWLADAKPGRESLNSLLPPIVTTARLFGVSWLKFTLLFPMTKDLVIVQQSAHMLPGTPVETILTVLEV